MKEENKFKKIGENSSMWMDYDTYCFDQYFKKFALYMKTEEMSADTEHYKEWLKNRENERGKV